MKTVFLSKKQTFLKVCVLTTLCLLIFSAHSDIQAAMKGNRFVFRAAPLIGPANVWLDASSSDSYATVTNEMDAKGLSAGIDLSVGRELGNNLVAGLEFTYQVVNDTEADINGVEITDPDFDLQMYNESIGSFLHYYFTPNIYGLLGSGLAVFWTGGESDAMDPTAYGVAISLGGGYDYPINQQIDIGAFVKVIYHNTWADDEGVDYYTQSLIAPAIGLSVTYKM
jgi:hypothetical protein